jgi:SAM-dependent methyltransferase
MTESISSRENRVNLSFRENYSNFGVDGYYSKFGENYRNPHEESINRALQFALTRRWSIFLGSEFWACPRKVFDLACGSGEITLFLQKFFENECSKRKLPAVVIDAADPYTFQAYRKRVGKEAEKLSFEDIEAGKLWNRHYDVTFCSFALHLLPESRLVPFCHQLALITDWLVILAPHKRPILDNQMGFIIKDNFVFERIHVRLCESFYHQTASLENNNECSSSTTY